MKKKKGKKKLTVKDFFEIAGIIATIAIAIKELLG